MPFLKANNPWNPHYVIPKNHLDAPERGVPVTGYTPRGTISFQPVLRPPLRGIKYLRRRTVSGILPSMFRPTGERNLALGDAPLGAKRLHQPSAGDPIGVFGREAANRLLDTLDNVPKEFRAAALHDVLDAVDPKIWALAEAKARELRAKKGYSPKVALRKALAIAFSNQMVRETVELSTKGTISLSGLLGLAAYGPGEALANFEAMAGIWGSIKGAAGSVAGGASWVGGKVKEGAVAVGSGIKKGATEAYGWGKDAVNWIGKQACKVVNSDLFTTAAAGGAMAAGAPPQAGAQGAEAAKGLCSSGEGGGAAYQPPPPAGIPMQYLLLGGAALAALIILK